MRLPNASGRPCDVISVSKEGHLFSTERETVRRENSKERERFLLPLEGNSFGFLEYPPASLPFLCDVPGRTDMVWGSKYPIGIKIRAEAVSSVRMHACLPAFLWLGPIRWSAAVESRFEGAFSLCTCLLRGNKLRQSLLSFRRPMRPKIPSKSSCSHF